MDDQLITIEVEKHLLSAMFLDEGCIVPKIVSRLDTDDFYRGEHRMIFNSFARLYASNTPIDYLSVEFDMRKHGDFQKLERRYLFDILNKTYTTARAEYHAKIVKDKSTLRKLSTVTEIMRHDIEEGKLSAEAIIAKTHQALDELSRETSLEKKASFNNFFTNIFQEEVDEIKNYVNRKSGFENLDKLQTFHPGLYVIGATPAAGKTTFCWQLLEQFARKGETCIYCSYEMSKLELFSKSVSRELFKRVPKTDLTAADVRRGAWSVQLQNIINDFSADPVDLSVLELKDETIDDLLKILRPLCANRAHAPVICLDYLQIVPSSKESAKLGIDDTVRKLKKFQRETNTTFIVISSFNRQNYTNSVSFECFKESGNIEYTADVVWGLQLNVLNHLRIGITEARQQIDEAKKKQPRQIQLKCLKNRQGTNYECFFNYFSAHDSFEPCRKFDDFDRDDDEIVSVELTFPPKRPKRNNAATKGSRKNSS